MFAVIMPATFYLPSSKLYGFTFLRTVFFILPVKASNSIEIIFYYGEGKGKDVPVHGMKAQSGVEVRMHSF